VFASADTSIWYRICCDKKLVKRLHAYERDRRLVGSWTYEAGNQQEHHVMGHIEMAVGVEIANIEARLFREFDNRRIGIGTESWIAEVYGVHVSDGGAWMQMASKDTPSRAVVVHVFPETTTGQVVVALSKWAQLPIESRPLVIDAKRIDAN
jgi:hypothetical protein